MQAEPSPPHRAPLVPETLPASPGQERLWLIAETEGSTASYAVPVGYHVRGRVVIERFRAAVRGLVARHDVLRTGLRWQNGRVVQCVHPSVEPDVIALEHVDLDGFVAAVRRAATESFELSRPPLVRALHAALPGGDTAFGFVFHHAICDSWTIELLLHDLAALLAGAAPEREAGRHARWSQEEHAWLGTPAAERDRAYWRAQFERGVPPLDIARGPRRAARRGDVHRFRLPTPVVDALVRDTVATRFAILLAAYAALLRRYSMNERIVIGLPLAGRASPEAERTVGYLSNTIVAVEDFSAQTTFRDQVRSALRHVAEGLEHGRLPFQDIVEVAGLRRDGNASLYQAMFGPQNTIDELSRLDGAALTRLRIHNGTAKCDLTLLVESGDDATECELEYDTDRFDAAWAEGFASAYHRLLVAAAEAPDRRVDELPLLDPGAAAHAFAPRAGAVDYTREPLAHVLFEDQARATPDAVAVTWSSGALTYRQLDERANAIAHALGSGRPAPRVGILLDRGPDLVSAVLGVLKAGGAFVPLDRRFPASRLAAICADAAISTIITDAERAADVAAIAPVLVPDGRSDPRRPDVRVSPDDLAYFYFTSGSTGRPKGVVIDHRCVMVRLAYMRDAYPVHAGEAVLHKTPLIFDIAIWEIFLPLFAGGAIVVVEPGQETDGAHLSELLRTEPIVLCHFVPSAVAAFLDSVAPRAYPRLRWVIVSGEAATVDLVHRTRRHFGVAVHSQYGQTETSEVTVWDGEGEERRPWSAPLGRAVGAYSPHIVDPALQPVPPDVPGELCVSAPGGLAWGYLDRPELTAQRFVPHPGQPGERLYRTGDMARISRAGLIEYLGRADHQLKIRGCRVEPGEIETVLVGHPAVSSCAVVAHAAPGGEPQLVAYVIASGAAPSPAVLDRHARSMLPWYMIPAAFVVLEQFPRTLSGKVDKDRLPPPDRRAFAVRADALEPPATPLEDTVAAEWTRVLGARDLGRTDDFFLVGGTSLNAIRVLAALGTRFGLKLKIADFTRQPTIAGLAEAIERGVEAMVSSLSETEVARLMQTMQDHEPGI